MHSTPQPFIAVTGHRVEAERLLAALPLLDKRHRNHHLQLALVNAVLTCAASPLVGHWQTEIEHPEEAP
jgi:hypothetical protein